MSDSTATASNPTVVAGRPINNGRVPESENCFDNPDSKLARRNADDKRKERWKNHLYALSALEGRREPWARRIIASAEYQDARRDPVNKGPALMCTGADAVEAGATDAEIAGLSALTPGEIAKLRLERAAIRELTRQQIRRRAAALAVAHPALSDAIRLAKDMVSDPPAGIIVDKLLYEKTVTSWVGDGGTYKTFTVLGLACSVAAGRDFSGQLRVPQQCPVLYMCAEHRRNGLIGDIRAWCQTNQVDVGSLELHGWDDVAQLGDDSQMDELSAYVQTHGIKLVVFDTQRKATKGLEENSSADMGAALANAQKLAYAANAAVVIIHHTTRGADHARGSSVMRDDTDATIIQRTVGEMAAEIVIDKHKSEPSGITYPIGLATVRVTGAPILDVGDGVAVPGEPFATLVARPRDPLTTDERADRARAALDPDGVILVAVVQENDGPPLSPTETHRRAATPPQWIPLPGGCGTSLSLGASLSTSTRRTGGAPTHLHSRSGETLIYTAAAVKRWFAGFAEMPGQRGAGKRAGKRLPASGKRAYPQNPQPVCGKIHTADQAFPQNPQNPQTEHHNFPQTPHAPIESACMRDRAGLRAAVKLMSI